MQEGQYNRKKRVDRFIYRYIHATVRSTLSSLSSPPSDLKTVVIARDREQLCVNGFRFVRKKIA